MTAKEVSNQLELYALASGYHYQHFYHGGWQFITTEAAQGFSIYLKYLITNNQYKHSSECLIAQPNQATLIRIAIELMREATGNGLELQVFHLANNLAYALEGQVDKAFPRENYAFGYFYREAWHFEGENTPEGYKIWLNFQFDSGDYRQTSSYILPSAMTQRELIGWTKTLMNEAFQQR